MTCTGKKTPGGAGTHTGHTGHTGARGHTDHTDEPHNHPPKPKPKTQADTNPHENRTDHTDEPHNHPPKPNDTNPHENRDRLNSRKNSRKPGVDRSPRPTQKRPPPANPTLPPPAPRAPPRACSKAVGEMKARAAVTPYTAAPSSRRLEALQSPPLLFVVLPTPPEPSWSLCGIPGAITSLIKGRLRVVAGPPLCGETQRPVLNLNKRSRVPQYPAD